MSDAEHASDGDEDSGTFATDPSDVDYASDGASSLDKAFADEAADADETVEPPQIWDAEQLHTRREDMIREASGLLSVSLGEAALLLRHCAWNKDRLQERFFDDMDRLLADAGVERGGLRFTNEQGKPPPDSAPSAHATPSDNPGDAFEQKMCAICCREAPECDGMLAAMGCQHYFCLDCWGDYLTERLDQGPHATSRTKCPQPQCSVSIGRDVFLSCSIVRDEGLQKRYLKYEAESFVDDNPKMRWCPFPDCNRCAYVRDPDPDEPPTVSCGCGQVYCFGCGEEAHDPSTCDTFKRWREKEISEDESGSWIAANTKPCPKCHSIIEKNGGCNRVTCGKCGHGFCWMCGASDHYACNVYNKTKELARDRAKQLHDMYMFYYDRYRTHDQSKKLEKGLLKRVRERMKKQQTSDNVLYSSVAYLEEGALQLISSRHVLKHTYAYAYFLRMKEEDQAAGKNGREIKKRRVGLPGGGQGLTVEDYWKKDADDETGVATGNSDQRFADNMNLDQLLKREHQGLQQGLRELFEHSQAQLEENVEKLSEMLDDRRNKFERQVVVNQTALVRASRQKLREGIFRGEL